MSLRNTSAIALALLAAVWLEPTSAGEANKGAGWPRGQYAALDKLPDWGGVWVLTRGAGSPARTEPQLKGEYLTQYQAFQKEVRENAGLARKDVSNCMPPGMPRMMGTGQYPIEWLFTPGRITMQHEAWMQTRTIYTDGRPHPEDLDPGIFGHSIGKWEGDTLVVDTIGIKPITEIETGVKHSARLHVVERIRLAPNDPDTLIVEMTMEDPEALAAPYKRTHNFKREREWNLMEFICAENDRNPVGADGHTQFD